MDFLGNIGRFSAQVIKSIRGERFCPRRTPANCPCGCLRVCPCAKPRYCPYRNCNYCPQFCRMKYIDKEEGFCPKYDECLDGTPYGRMNGPSLVNPGTGQNIVSKLQTCSGNPLNRNIPVNLYDCGCARRLAADSYQIISDANNYYVGPIGVAAKKDGMSFYYSPGNMPVR